MKKTISGVTLSVIRFAICVSAGAQQKVPWLGWFYILGLLSLSTSVSGAEAEGERLHVGYSIFAGVTAPLWATKEGGLFEKNGLNVQLIYLRGGTEAAQALITGDVPFAMMGGGAVIASNLAGSGSVILAGIENAILFKLVTAKEIESGEKLRGR